MTTLINEVELSVVEQGSVEVSAPSSPAIEVTIVDDVSPEITVLEVSGSELSVIQESTVELNILDAPGAQVTYEIQAPSAFNTFTVTTASLAVGAAANFTLPAGRTYALLSITASTPCWLRVYGTEIARTTDPRTSPGGTPPEAGSGFYAELATSAPGQSISLAPVPIIQGLGTGGLSYCKVVNTDTVSRVITLTFLVLSLKP